MLGRTATNAATWWTSRGIAIPPPAHGGTPAAAEMSLRQNLFDAAHSVAILELVAATEHAARTAAAQQGVRHTERITADLRRRLDWPLRPFPVTHGAEHLPDLKRYMQGIAERIRRIGQHPGRGGNAWTSLNAALLASGPAGT
ncbi:MAG: DUF3418 domain-containing protein [Akkermansia sp.]